MLEEKVQDFFGCDVFNEMTMRQRLPKDVFKAVKKTISLGRELPAEVADVVASAMKDWALEKGATHFTHWFQPMTGITAEKHDSFISPTGDGHVIMEFSGKNLVKGEPDASSFPSGGIRATFEARGYTAWDPTSYAFVKDGTLYIPTAFCSYTGEALDKKTPLLRSIDSISNAAIRLLRLFGNNHSTRVVPTVGCEQEYFLIDKKLHDQRKDLIFTGRTLFGAPAPKGQELEDHYFGSLKQRVSDFMKDFDNALWKLGVPSKTKHNEVAPAQHEMAPIFASVNIATDQNQLVMEVLKKTAQKHGLVALLHEKPFAGVNGSGKHNNWGLSTDDGINLLVPGDTPMKNAQFLLFLAAIIRGVDIYADLLRLSVATAGNDHRLGADEAPPAIISIYLGEDLTEVVESIVSGAEVSDRNKQFDIGISTLPKFPKDPTDRNRTSPFAFTGNKFEFRSVGSSLNVAGPNIILNTVVADSLKYFADELEKADNFDKRLEELLVETIKKHKRIIFNGNGYDEEWVKEAEKRGLNNYKSTVDAVPHFADEKNIELFTSQNVFNALEVHSRTEILLENYEKTLNIEALTALTMAKKEILPAVLKYSKMLSDSAFSKKTIGISADTEISLVKKIDVLTCSMYRQITKLEDALNNAHGIKNIRKLAQYMHDVVLTAIQELRIVADELETFIGAEYWPFPTYTELLFNI
ncbi:MAG: glutamine synthetase type III [Clostridiales bacterium]|nr:glutamine synthetase type III [Clostridiales bacterium]